jgi:DnaJ-class molecular chaperone
MKAYRKLAVKWHPDHYQGDDKKKAERMFIDIAAAKEVLTDPGKYLGRLQRKKHYIETAVLDFLILID